MIEAVIGPPVNLRRFETFEDLVEFCANSDPSVGVRIVTVTTTAELILEAAARRIVMRGNVLADGDGTVSQP